MEYALRSLGQNMVTSKPKTSQAQFEYADRSKSLVRVGATLPARRDDAKVFLREFTRELVREISPATKILALAGVVLLVSSLLYFGRAALLRYSAQPQQNSSQAESLKSRIDEQDRLLAHLNERTNQTSEQILDLMKTQSEPSENSQSVLTALSLPNTLWKSYSNGTCLIAGIYRLIDRPTGLPLRYPDVEMSAEERLLTIGTEVPLTAQSKGSIFELEFLGTGFYVGDGYVLTNRHIASQPWAADERAQYFIARTGAIPRLAKLLAFFPGHSQPIPLNVNTVSATDDVAVCRLRTASPNIPALPLDRQLGAIEVGKAVVMMGYPTGPNRLLALLPEAEATAVQNEYGGSLVTLLDQLAKRKLIKPLTTQGHITDLYKNRIVFDAATTQGSSGTPMLGESGKVIGITFAVFIDDSASNFAVPIAAAIEELKKAGWKPPTNEK